MTKVNVTVYNQVPISHAISVPQVKHYLRRRGWIYQPVTYAGTTYSVWGLGEGFKLPFEHEVHVCDPDMLGVVVESIAAAERRQPGDVLAEIGGEREEQVMSEWRCAARCAACGKVSPPMRSTWTNESCVTSHTETVELQDGRRLRGASALNVCKAGEFGAFRVVRRHRAKAALGLAHRTGEVVVCGECAKRLHGYRGGRAGKMERASRYSVVFLDIDGVLARQGRPDPTVFDRTCVARLKRIVERTGARIVVSSSWVACLMPHELDERLELIERLLAEHGLTVKLAGALDLTNGGSKSSKVEALQAWLREHRPWSWVVLDDYEDMADVDPGRLVQPPGRYGLQDHHVAAAISALRTPWSGELDARAKVPRGPGGFW